MEFSSPLSPGLTSNNSAHPVHFLIKDGVQVLKDTIPKVYSSFTFDTDSAGQITGWGMTASLSDDIQGLLTNLLVSNDSPTSHIDVGQYTPPHPIGPMNEGVSFVPGTWLGPVAGPSSITAPEPSSLTLLALGLAGIGVRVRWDKRRLVY